MHIIWNQHHFAHGLQNAGVCMGISRTDLVEQRMQSCPIIKTIGSKWPCCKHWEFSFPSKCHVFAEELKPLKIGHIQHAA